MSIPVSQSSLPTPLPRLPITIKFVLYICDSISVL